MAAPWLKYQQAPAAGPWTKYAQADAPAAEAPQGELANALNVFGYHVTAPFEGAAQLVEHGVNAAANLLPDGNPVRGYVNRTVASDDAAMRANKREYDARTHDGVGATAGAVVGDVLPFLGAGVARTLQAGGEKVAGLLPEGWATARKLASLGTQGAVVGASQPVTGEGSYAAQKALQTGGGAALGVALPVAGSAVRGLARVAAPIVAPQRVANAQLARLYGSDPATLAALENAPQHVPGETVTAAQALATPRAVMVEKAMRNRPEMKEQFTAADNANNANRLAVIRGHAGDDTQMRQAITARRGATADYLQQLGQSAVDPAPVLDALQRLQAGALSVHPTVKKAAAAVLDDLHSRIGPDGKIGGDMLDAIRQNIGGFLAQHAPNGAVGTKEEAAFVPIKAQIIRALDAAVPGYRDYLGTYAAKSVPINTMEASQRILAPIDAGGDNSSGDKVLTLTRLNSGLNKADKARYGLSPEARGDMEGVRQSLQRASRSDSIKSGGSDTAYNLEANGWLAKQMFGPNMSGPTGKGYGLAAAAGALAGHSIAPGMLGEFGGGALAAGLKKGADAINTRIAKRVGAGAVDSREAAHMIRSFLAYQSPSVKRELLQAYPQWGALIGVDGARQLAPP